MSAIVLSFALSLLCVALAQNARPNGGGAGVLDPLRPQEETAVKSSACSQEFRTFDGTCTNDNGKRKLWGSAGRPHFSYFPLRSAVNPGGADLPSARYISNTLCKQSADRPNRRALSELVTFFGQFLDHTIVASSANTRSSMPIEIPEDDPIFGNFSGGKLPFHRNVRDKTDSGAEVPINSLSSAIDLASIYGADDLRIAALRTFKNGGLTKSSGNMLQVNSRRLRNAPSNSPHFFLSGDHRANEHPALTSLHTLFMREHNNICKELHSKFPNWSDEKLFQNARKVNIAQFQKIVYEEFFPAVTGRRVSWYRGFKPWVHVGVSDIFSTAAFRVGHTMVGNGVSRRGKGMAYMRPLSMQEMFFRPRSVMKGGIEPFIRGGLFYPAQEIDIEIHNSLRNFLFKLVPEEVGFDLIALNIQRGRDHNLPSYNTIRQRFGLPPARSFSQITRKVELQVQLSHIYKHPHRVEAWVGMVAEDHALGSSLGPTMLRVWTKEFERLRDGDRFFYLRAGLFSSEMWFKVPRLRAMMFEKETFKSIILRNTNIPAWEMKKPWWRSLKS